MGYIPYGWQTGRYPVSAEVQGDVEGQYTVQAGRSDVITDPAMHADDESARKSRAMYVCKAVNGRNVKSGETTTIPIPRSDEGVHTLLSTLRSDETTVSETNVDELGNVVNDVVYELFEISQEEQDVIEDYLETFRVY
jgi:hypothetical protein